MNVGARITKLLTAEVESMKQTEERIEARPNRYHEEGLIVCDIQERVYFNIINGKLFSAAKHLYKVALWVTYALKHLLRLGNKDDIYVELFKAENYLRKARTGSWIDPNEPHVKIKAPKNEND